jgi:hypothetical protein
MSKLGIALVLGLVSIAGAANAAVGDVAAGPLSVVRHIAPADMKASGVRVVGAKAPLAVDPLAVYSNITTFGGSALSQGAAAGGITRLVADDVTITTNPGVSNVTTIRFTVSNGNAVSKDVRARVRIYSADGAPLGAGLPNAPGTIIAGYSFNILTFTPGVTTLTGNLGTGFAVPVGATSTIWMGLTFDNVGTTLGTTDADLNNFGQGFFTPVDLGSSTDTLFETTAPGSFLANNPAGAALGYAGTPVANVGWELVVTTLPVELQSFSTE